MSDICTILPLKAFGRAKSRLCPVLSAAERLRLSRLMAEDALRTLAAEPLVGHIVIAGQEPAHAELAAAHGCEYIEDDPSLDVSANVTRAVQATAVARGATLFYVAADLPLLTPGDIGALLARPFAGLTICRAARDNGTNGLLAAPAAAATFDFGSGSAARHAATARASGWPVRIVDIAGFRRDVDEPADLAWFCTHGTGGAALDYLNRSGIAARFTETPAASLAS